MPSGRVGGRSTSAHLQCLAAPYPSCSPARCEVASTSSSSPTRTTTAGRTTTTFQTDIGNLIEQAYFGKGDTTTNASLYLTNQDTFNFWIAGGSGDARGVVDDKCEKDAPATWSILHSFADVGAIIHKDGFRDCASGNTFSANATDFTTFRHEQGHRPFGLADEYCFKRPSSMSSNCDGGYFQTDIFPNVYEAGSDCENDAAALGRPTAPSASSGPRSAATKRTGRPPSRSATT